MKVLIINGSPRRHGTVENILVKVAQGLGDQVEVSWAHVYELNMSLCRACMKCRPDGECVFPEDDAHRVGRMIPEADALVIGTPTHWGNMSSGLKILLDRLVPTLMGEKENGLPLPRHKGKPAVLVTACTTPWPFNFIAAESRGAFRAVGEVLHYSGFKTVAKIAVPGTKNRNSLKARIENKALKVGRRLGSRQPQRPDSAGSKIVAYKNQAPNGNDLPATHRFP